MQLFAPSISMRSGGRIQVIRLRHPDRDWPQLFRGALGDTAELLGQIKQTAPQARIGLVGHSNGGRVALRLSSDARVDAVAALAPWIVRGDRILPRPGQPVLLMHGDYDRVTDPKATRALAERLRQRDVLVDIETLADTHALMLRSWHWHRRVARFLREHLLD